MKLPRRLRIMKFNISEYLYKIKKKPYYDDYCFWMVLKDECDKVTFTDDILNDAKQLKRIECIFNEMSKHYLKRFKSEDLVEIWCETKDMKSEYMDLFEQFTGYLWYSSDRMNINRWLYCRLSISNAFQQFYSAKMTTVDICSNWYEVSEQIEEECSEWFKYKFPKLYRNRLKEDE